MKQLSFLSFWKNSAFNERENFFENGNTGE